MARSPPGIIAFKRYGALRPSAKRRALLTRRSKKIKVTLAKSSGGQS